MKFKIEIVIDIPSKKENPYLGETNDSIWKHCEWMCAKLADHTGNIRPVVINVFPMENLEEPDRCSKCNWFTVKTSMGPSCLNLNCEMP